MVLSSAKGYVANIGSRGLLLFLLLLECMIHYFSIYLDMCSLGSALSGEGPWHRIQLQESRCCLPAERFHQPMGRICSRSLFLGFFWDTWKWTLRLLTSQPFFQIPYITSLDLRWNGASTNPETGLIMDGPWERNRWNKMDYWCAHVSQKNTSNMWHRPICFWW